MPQVMHRTEVPGVYRRGSRFVAVWQRARRQRKRSFRSMEEAVAFKAAQTRDREAARLEILNARTRAARRSRADLTDAYADVRRALQAVDRTETDTPHRIAILTVLHEAEDRLGHAIRGVA